MTTRDLPLDGQPTAESGLRNVPQAPEDLMFGLSAAYRSDASSQKVDLGVGAYRDDDAQPWVLPAVRKAEKILHANNDLIHEYLPITGLAEYVKASQNLLLGASSQCVAEDRVASMQTLSGTGALYLGSLFLSRFIAASPSKKVYVSTPAYANHIPIFENAGLETASYPYYNPATSGLDFRGMVDRIASIPNGSIVMLQACAHNPTGVDPTQGQWQDLAKVMKDKRHLPFFDCAYQGFASGDINADAYPIRHFAEQDFDVLIVAQSYAKNMGMYGERVGCLHVVASTSIQSERILSQLKRLQRVIVSTPPAYGAKIVSLILNDTQLSQEWLQDLRLMSDRIKNMRHQLRTRLEESGAPGSWEHVTDQQGMFCFSGLDTHQVMMLRTKYSIYTTPDGRLSMSGLNRSNLKYVADAIKAILTRQSL